MADILQKSSPGVRAILIHTVFALFKVIYVIFWAPGLFFEEAQYWLWSKYLDWSYYSKPPLIAWVNYFSTSVFGDTEIGVRINAIFCGWLIAFFVYRIAHDLTKSQRMGMWASLSLLIFPYYWIISLFFTTDSLVTLCWIVALYFLLRFVRRNNISAVYMGLAIGLGLLSKYVMALFIPFLLTYIFLYHREKFRSPALYFALIIAAAMCLPIVYWNYINDWVTVRHVGQLARDPEKFNVMRSLSFLGEYLGGQFLIWMWVFFFPFMRGFRDLFKRNPDERTFFLLAPVLAVLVFFLLIGFQSRVEVNWTFFVLPATSVYAGIIFTPEMRRPTRVKMAVMGFLLMVLLFLPVIEKSYNAPLSVNPFRRFAGWEEMAASLDDYLKTIPGEYYLVIDSYSAASMMAFYLQQTNEVFVYNPGARMTQFNIWAERYYPMVQHKKAVYLEHERNTAVSPVGVVLDTTNVRLQTDPRNAEKYDIVLYEKFESPLFYHNGY